MRTFRSLPFFPAASRAGCRLLRPSMGGGGGRGQRAVAVVGSVALVGAGAVVLAGPAQAGTPVTVYVSTSGSTSADCLTPGTACATVSEGVAAAQTLLAASSSIDVTVSIAAGDYIDNVSINSVPRGDTLTLAGPAAIDTSINGGGNGTVITVNGGVVAVSDLTLTGGKGDGGVGGGIINDGGTVTVSGSTLSGNTASYYGSGIYNENRGTVAVSGSTVSDNITPYDGGSYPYGGGIYNETGATVTVSGSTLSGNSAFDGSGIFNQQGGTVTVSGSTLSDNTATGDGGGIDNGGTVTVSGSTLSGNTATYGGGGIESGGTLTVSGSTLSGNYASSAGGIENQDGGTLTVSGSTLSGNSAFWGGGILNAGTATVSGSTLSGNTADAGGGAINNGGTLTVSGSTLSDNTASPNYGGGGIDNDEATVALAGSILSDSPCIGTAVTDRGFNVTSDHSCVASGGSSVVDSATIGLGSLAANGSTGPLTQAIDATSSAHQLVPTSSGLCTPTDERGRPRPGVTGASSCDAGAFELQASSGPTTVNVTVTGAERVGGTPSFATSQTLPDGISLTGSVTCTAVDGGAAIATLPAGGYTIDPTTCAGLSLDGTGSSGYAISYTGGAFTAIAVTPTKLNDGRTGSKYHAHLGASGGTAPYSYTVTGGDLPDGVVLSNGGVFSGTPTTPGTSAFTVTVTDSTGVTVTADYTLLIGLQITPAKLLPATYDKSYSAHLTGDGTGPLHWSIVSGALPAGLSLDPDTGYLTGIPTAAGRNSFVVQVTDSASPAQTGRITYYVTVQLAVSTALKAGKVGRPYSATVTAAGGTAPYTWTLTNGNLPDGLTLTPDGHITGIPTTAGKIKFSLTVTDTAGPPNTLTHSYTITIT